jgi:hypothetical protein
MRGRSLLLPLTLLTGCGRGVPSEADCRKLVEPHAVIARCFHGNLAHGRYVGDLSCFPFSRPERMDGIWIVSLENSSFDWHTTRLSPTAAPTLGIWLEPGRWPPDAEASAQGDTARAFAVKLIGRRSLCAGSFGHMGVFPREVIVDRFLSRRLIWRQDQPPRGVSITHASAAGAAHPSTPLQRPALAS